MKNIVTIKKTQEAGYSQDSATWRGIPGTYGVFVNGRQVGIIKGSERRFWGGCSDWSLEQLDNGGCPREIKHFWNPDPFKQAREFALRYDWLATYTNKYGVSFNGGSNVNNQ